MILSPVGVYSSIYSATRCHLLPQLSLPWQTAEIRGQESDADWAAGKSIGVGGVYKYKQLLTHISCLPSKQVDVSDVTKTTEAFLKIASVYKEENTEVKAAVLDSIGEALWGERAHK